MKADHRKLGSDPVHVQEHNVREDYNEGSEQSFTRKTNDILGESVKKLGHVKSEFSEGGEQENWRGGI